jgi:hypothetical protein
LGLVVLDVGSNAADDDSIFFLSVCGALGFNLSMLRSSLSSDLPISKVFTPSKLSMQAFIAPFTRARISAVVAESLGIRGGAGFKFDAADAPNCIWEAGADVNFLIS